MQKTQKAVHALSTKTRSRFPTNTNTNTRTHSILNLLSSSSSSLSCKSLLQIHGHLITLGLAQHEPTATHFINSYASFNKLDSAITIFNSLQSPSVRLYNTIIRAYTNSNYHKHAIQLYRYMLDNDIQPDKYSFTFVLKACTALLDFQEGMLVHEEVRSRGLEGDVFIATGLVDMYGKLGELECARRVFDEMPVKDVVTWNAMIAGLSQSSQVSEVFGLFREMRVRGIEVNYVSVLNLLPGVSRLGDVWLCEGVHGYVVKRGFGLAVLNGLIDAYSKCGEVEKAWFVLEGMVARDDVSWGTMMAGYVYNGWFCEGLELFGIMKEENVRMNKVSIVNGLVAAAETRDLDKGKEIHECAIRQGIDSDVSVATSILTMYAKCGEIDKAKQLFKVLAERDLVAWSALLAAFVQTGYPEEALSLFRDMQDNSLKPNMVTLMSVLPACADLTALKLGKSVHCYAIKGDLDSNISVGTALVSMYAKCGLCTSAHILFNRMTCRDVVTWNALINGYIQIGDPNNVVKLFQNLQLSDRQPDSGTMMSLVSACLLSNDLDQGSCIHGQIIKRGFEPDSRLWNNLIDMYARFGSLHSAELLFSRAEFMKDEVSWNVMIAGYLQNGLAREAISTFILMILESFRPNLVTYISVIPAVAFLASLKEGMSFHAHIIKTGFLSNTLVGNSLVDMYSKCGELHYAEKCFSEIENKTTVSWNAMLGGYATHGHGGDAVSFFLLMQKSAVQVDSVSFLEVLSACRHAGLVKEGRVIFESMQEKHNLEPALEHYACMVDLLGCAGSFDEVLGLIEKMPMKADAGVWGALLGACEKHANVPIGELALNHLVKLEPENMTNYVVLSNLYAHSSRWGDAGRARSKMNVTGMKKIPGCSWVEENKQGLCFSVT